MAIARVALPVAADRLFDYWLPEGLGLGAGSVVRVTLGRRRMHGVVAEVASGSELDPDRVLPIQEAVSVLPAIPEDLRSLARFVSVYYQQPIGQCFAQMLPPLGSGRGSREPLAARYRLSDAGRTELEGCGRRSVRVQELCRRLGAPDGEAAAALRELGAEPWRRFSDWRRRGLVEPVPVEPAPGRCAIDLNAEQEAALAAFFEEPPGFGVSLLQGVTGSGKTEVYLAAAARVIAEGRQALLLVPEIHLTPQLVLRVGAALPGACVGVLHSALGAPERLRRWLDAARGETQLVVGTRLAVFAPLPRLGLIVVDEEHDPSFRQQDGVRYHARDVAIYRARLREVPVLLGSATPSLESYAQAQRGRYRWLRLARRARAGASLPSVRLVPSRAPGNVEGMAAPLRAAIEERLARGEQSLLFINRRGFAPSLLCVACGWKAACPRCAARLVVHREVAALRCHHCGHDEPIARACPQCGNADLLPAGYGTQRLEHALATLFPKARVMRVDRDSTRGRGAFAAMLGAITSGAVDILVGTQMLAKGHDFPQLTLVGVLGSDNALYSADFRATERLFALLEQVAGRAGRGAPGGEVLVQTDFPEHPLYAALAAHDYDRFAQALLAERRALRMPPYGHLALLAAEARTRSAVDAFLQRAAACGAGLAARTSGGSRRRCEVYPPVAAPLARRAGLERGQVLVHAFERPPLQEFLPRWRAELERLLPRTVRWTLEVDPPTVA